MELTYNELKKREVINIVDGKSLGRITDMKFKFPQGVIQGIEVEGRRVCPLFKVFNKSNVYIPDSNIVKIGGDVILVNIRCGDTCLESSGINGIKSNDKSSHQKPHCPPPCPPKPNCPPPCPPKPPCSLGLGGSLEEMAESENKNLPFNFDEY